MVIARGAEPVVKLTPVNAKKRSRTYGAFKGQFELTDAFFEPLPDDELALWNGEGE